MGLFINIGNAGFQRARNSEYVDKSALIAVVNSTINTEKCFSCVSRSRRFGKSMATKMLNSILLVGINYDRETKQHTCRIERISHRMNETAKE